MPLQFVTKSLPSRRRLMGSPWRKADAPSGNGAGYAHALPAEPFTLSGNVGQDAASLLPTTLETLEMTVIAWNALRRQSVGLRQR